jgi:hypothetical protein
MRYFYLVIYRISHQKTVLYILVIYRLTFPSTDKRANVQFFSISPKVQYCAVLWR